MVDRDDDPCFPKVIRLTDADTAMLALRRAVSKCGPNATAILVRQAARLATGAETYGDDFDDGRDWLLEMIAEASDFANYAERAALLGPLPSRVSVARSLVAQAHMMLQAELADRQRQEAAE